MSFVSVLMDADWEVVVVLSLSHEQPTTEPRTKAARQDRIRVFMALLRQGVCQNANKTLSH